MKHLTEEELILQYYGEAEDAPAAERHLEECQECRELFASLELVLQAVDGMPVPERGAEYGVEVWRRIEAAIPAPRTWLRPAWPRFEWRWAAGAAAMACLLAAAFFAGRHYPQSAPARQTAVTTAPADPQSVERVLLVAVGEYLERSQMVLSELANADAKGKLDISHERERAADLVNESRLYRQTAEHTGDTAVAGTLDEIDRVLLDIARGPSEVSPAQLKRLRERLKGEGILFKIRVLGSQVRTQQIKDAPPAADRGRRTL